MEPELPSLIHYYRTIPLHFIFVFLKAILPLSENEWDYDLTPTYIPIPFLITFLFNKNWYVFPRQTSLSPFPMIRIRPRLLRWCCQLFFSFESEVRGFPSATVPTARPECPADYLSFSSLPLYWSFEDPDSNLLPWWERENFPTWYRRSQRVLEEVKWKDSLSRRKGASFRSLAWRAWSRGQASRILERLILSVLLGF